MEGSLWLLIEQTNARHVNLLTLSSSSVMYLSESFSRTAKPNCAANYGVGGQIQFHCDLEHVNRLTTETFQFHRKLLPAEVTELVCSFFCVMTMSNCIMRRYYDLILLQGPRPYRFEPIHEQWRVTRVNYMPIYMIIDFLV